MAKYTDTWGYLDLGFFIALNVASLIGICICAVLIGRWLPTLKRLKKAKRFFSNIAYATYTVRSLVPNYDAEKDGLDPVIDMTDDYGCLTFG
jgi:hypothetical protein